MLFVCREKNSSAGFIIWNDTHSKKVCVVCHKSIQSLHIIQDKQIY